MQLISVLPLLLRRAQDDLEAERELQRQGYAEPPKAGSKRLKYKRMLSNKQNGCRHQGQDSELSLVTGIQYKGGQVSFSRIPGKKIQAIMFRLHATCRRCKLDHYFEVLITPEAIEDMTL